MLPLKSLPKVLKHAEGGQKTPERTVSPVPSAPTPSVPPNTTSGPSQGPRSLESTTQPKSFSTQSTSSRNVATTSNSAATRDESTSAAISALEEKEKNLQERLVVLEEQRFFVSNMIADANRHRKFDEVSSLAMNVEDLSHEIDRVNDLLGKLDFEEVYTGRH